MTLLELSDPLFKYVCFLNRSARKGAPLDPAQVDSEIEAILSDIRSKARANPGLSDQYEKVDLPLLCFIDNVICSGSFELAGNWNRLAYKRDVYTGDDEFGILLDKTLSEPESVSSNERLAIFYVCLGLGFVGGNFEDVALRQQRMTQIARRIRSMTELEDRARITPQAYSHTVQDNLVPPPVGTVWKIGVALVGMVIVLIVMNAYLYRTDLGDLKTALTNVHQPQATAEVQK